MRPSEIRQALLEIENGLGRITPRGIWEAAEPPDHVLHGQFTWDDTECGKLYRDQEARHLIARAGPLHDIVVSDQPIEIAPVYIRDPAADPGEQGMVRLETIEEKDERLVVMMRELSLARSYLTRAQNIGVALGFGNLLDVIVGEVDAALRHLERQEAERRAA